MRCTNVFIIFFALAAFLCGGAGAASDTKIEVRGYGTFGIMYHDSNDLIFHRDLFQEGGVDGGDISLTELSRVGFQIDTRTGGPFDFTMQVVARSNTDYKWGDSIKLVALSYEANANIQLRLGRVRPRRFMYSETKSLGFSQLWTMPVHEVYGPTPNDFVDGAEINMNMPIGDGFFRTNIGYGEFTLKGKDPLGTNNTIEFRDHFTSSLEYEILHWVFRTAYTTARISDVSNSTDAIIDGLRQVGNLANWQEGLTLADALDMRGITTEFYSAGLTYQDGVWDIAVETTLTTGGSDLIPRSSGSYLSVGYRKGIFTPYFVLATAQDKDDERRLNSAPPPIPGAESLAGFALFAANANIEQSSVSLGLRYEVSSKSAVKLQINHKKVTENGNALWAVKDRSTYADTEETILVYSATYEFVF